jgi:hypothetical protein
LFLLLLLPLFPLLAEGLLISLVELVLIVVVPIRLRGLVLAQSLNFTHLVVELVLCFTPRSFSVDDVAFFGRP